MREHLKAGALHEAARLVGRPPVLRRPKSGVAHLAWAAGAYTAVPLPTADLPATADAGVLDLELVAEADGMAALAWPSPSIKYLSFISGPAEAQRDARQRYAS